MFIRIAAIILTCFTIPACNQRGKYYEPNTKDSPKRVVRKIDSAASLVQTVETNLNENDLQLFCNNEMTAYCVLLPLHEFREDFTNQSVVKAQHKFLLMQDSTSFTSIEVQGFSIDKKNNYNTTMFFEKDKKNVEQGGLGIDTAYINKTNHLYVIKGHLPNYMNMKFVQLNWILENRISIYLNYDEKEEALWQQRIAAIIKRGVN